MSYIKYDERNLEFDYFSGLFDDGFTAPGLTHEQTKPALVAMDLQHIKHLLLMVQQSNGAIDRKRIDVDTVKRPYHDRAPRLIFELAIRFNRRAFPMRWLL